MDASQKNSVNRGLTFLDTRAVGSLRLQGNIVLGDFIFNTVDEFGITWVVTDITGWWQHPNADMPEIDRGFGDGAYDVQGRYKARQLAIEGVFLCPDPSLVEAARDRLVAASNLVYKGAWLKTGSNPIRASWVRLSGDISINTTNTRGRTEFTIGLRAADPIKYSWNDTSQDGYDVVEIAGRDTSNLATGSGIVTNIGNYPAPCIFEVIGGPMIGPASIYNRTTDQLMLINGLLQGTQIVKVVNKQLTFDVTTLKDIVTLTTSTQHGFAVGDDLNISGIGSPFDGDHIITSIPTDTTLTYETSAASVKSVAYKALAANVATVETTTAHGLTTGQEVTINGVDSVFDGTYKIASTPTASKFTYAKTRIPPRTVIARSLVSNIATLTTSDIHQFIVGDTVVVSGIDVNFNGTFTITALPSDTEFSYAATRTNARSVINKSMAGDNVTLTTSTPHGFVVNENVNVSGVDLSLNGGYTISAITSSTFTYKRVRATEKSISIKALSSNVATITTSSPHGFIVGEKVTIEGVDSTFNGTYVITSLPSNATFTYAKTASDVLSTAVDFGLVHSTSRQIKSRQIIGNVATITTTNTHGVILGEQIAISGIGTPFDGTFVVTSIPTATSFTYAITSANVALADAPTTALAEMLGTITSTGVVPDGLATVAGSLPYAAVAGSASVSDAIDRVAATGKVIQKNDVVFTPGISGAVATRSADILEIDTKNREVAFNGEVTGARGRLEVLVDYIQLAPGDNVIEFVDTNDNAGKSTLRVFYRSGWLA